MEFADSIFRIYYQIYRILPPFHKPFVKASLLCNLFSLVFSIATFLSIAVNNSEITNYIVINDKTRGRGTFRQTFSSLEKIRDNDYGKKASIRCTLNQNNMHALDGYTKLAKEMGLYELSFGWMTPSGRGATCFSDVGLFAEEYKSVAQRIKALQQSSDAEGLLISGLEISLSCPMIANDDSAALNMHINSFGEVYLCSQLMIDAFCLGNIHEQSIEEILHHDRTYEILYRLRERQSWDVEDCSTCFLKRKCKRGCPGLAIRFGGLMHSDGQCLPRKQVMAEVMRTPR